MSQHDLSGRSITSTTNTDKKDVSLAEEDISEVRPATTDGQRTLWQNAKRYQKVTYITLGLSSAILLYGYDNVIVGAVSGMPAFQKDFGIFYQGKWILPSTWLALWNVASPIGAMIGSLFGGWLQDRVGRRVALGLSSFFSAIGVAIMFCSYLPSDVTGRRVAFLMGKFFQGGAIGAVMASCQTYMSEVLPPVLRGSGMAFFPAFQLLGQLIGALVIYGSLDRERGYAIAFGSQWPFSCVPIIVAFLIPESPAWYVRKRRMDDAYTAQARLDPPGVDSKVAIHRLLKDIEGEASNSAAYLDCFKRGNVRRTGIVMWAQSLTSVFGLQLLAKASYFLQLIDMKPGISIIFLILGIILGLIANLISVWIMARVGRRPLVISGLLTAAVLWASMGIANCTKINPAVTWWTASSMMLTIFICGLGVWPSSFAIAAETSSLQLRAKTQGIGWFVSALSATAAGLALPYVFNPDEGNLRGKIGFTYAASCLVGAGISWLVVPEMKGRSVGEIDGMFEAGLPARKCGSWRKEDGAMLCLYPGSASVQGLHVP